MNSHKERQCDAPPMHTQCLLGSDILEYPDAVRRMGVHSRKDRTWVVCTMVTLIRNGFKCCWNGGETYPIGIIARSNGPSLSPISLKAGQTGTFSGSSPSQIVRYPVSPAKYTFLGGSVLSLSGTSSRVQEAHNVCHRSNKPRFAVC